MVEIGIIPFLMLAKIIAVWRLNERVQPNNFFAYGALNHRLRHLEPKLEGL